jgi:OOP family OmpA-OmpF porin
MNYKSIIFNSAMAILVSLLIIGPASAAEIITEEDLVKRIVVEDQFLKMADNFLILFDASDSMKRQYKKGAPESRYEVAKNVLKQKIGQLPDLGYNAGLYLYTPYKEVYPMSALDKGRFAQAVDSLPAEPKGPTFLPEALRKIEPKLKGLSGKTIVYIMSDGTFSELGQFKEPEDYTQEFADKYNVCFYMIGAPQDNRAQKRLVDMSKANACSRVIPFQQFIDNPEYITGALYVVKATEKIVTISDQKVVGLKTDNILFAFDKADLEEPYLQELDEIGMFLQKEPEAFLAIDGYADEVGNPEYNMQLSRRRAESAANYLMQKYNIDSSRMVLNWYGSANPVASNDNIDGRAQNRRVEIAIGGL